MATGGNPGDGWTGALAPSGSMTVTETSAGTVSYSITCAGAPPAATAHTSVVIVTAAAAATGSSHGGGSIDPLLLLFLGVLVGVSLARDRRDLSALHLGANEPSLKTSSHPG
jgi:hypothetical protein